MQVLRVLLLILCLFLIQRHANAEELQVTDYLGLVRAERTIAEKALLRITVRRIPGVEGDESMVPVLTQRTGIAPDIDSEKVSENEFVFRGVSPGIWRIRLRNKALLLDVVEIVVDANTGV